MFDVARCSIAHAAVIRGGGVADYRAFALLATAITDLATKRARVRLVHAPLPDDQRPGANAHYGIEGLDGVAGEDKVEWKKSLRELADACAVHVDP